jgi:hypothetical protein
MTTVLEPTWDETAADENDDAAGDRLGIIGSRQLVAVQTFDIARLTSDPVVLRPSCFIAVTGRGPTDSNESGKTSFNAAVSLLLGDPEWRLGGGGLTSVAQLLFEPDTAGVAGTRYPAAQWGFIVGVFADPEDPQDTAHTVWLRLAPGSPYLLVRHAPGTHLVQGSDDSGRHEAASQLWKELPSSNLGPRNFAQVLYGRSPRCLAYVAARGKQRSGPSLLKMDAGAFTPEAIGAALVKQSGRAEAFEREQQHRAAAAALDAQLREQRMESIRLAQDEERNLLEVTSRMRGRELLADGQQAWRQHFARGLLDTLARQQQLTTQVEELTQQRDEAKDRLALARRNADAFRSDKDLADRLGKAKLALDDVARRLRAAEAAETTATTTIDLKRQVLAELEAKGARQARLDVEAATIALKESNDELLAAKLAAAGLESTAEGLQSELDAAREGAGLGLAGDLVAVLTSTGIEAYSLIDDLAIDEEHRNTWQARVAPWRDAVIVPARAQQALVELTADGTGRFAGAVIIDAGALVGSSDALEGVTAQEPTVRFLRALEQLAPLANSGTRAPAGTAVIASVAATILGGFPAATTGLAQRISALEQQLLALEGPLAAAGGRIGAAEQQVTISEDELDQAKAAAEYTTTLDQIEALETTELPQVRLRVEELTVEHASAEEAHLALVGANASQDATKQQLQTAVDQANTDLTAADLELRRASETLTNQRLDYWVSGFVGTPAEARAALGWPADHQLDVDGSEQARPPAGTGDGIERRTRRTLAINANGALDKVLLTLGIDENTGEGAAELQIQAAVKERARIGQDANDGQERTFDVLALPLEAWLDKLGDRDEQAKEAIEALRAERALQEEYVQGQLNGLREGLANIQDAMQSRIEDSLRDIRGALDRLDREAGGFGADLCWDIIRPAGASDAWEWKVTPRWRRTVGGTMLPYDNATNTAQEKLFSVHLVLAALLASPHPRGRVLILDELGDSLGEDHRRRVLNAIQGVAERYGVTVLGTCQDAVMPDAAKYCGEVLFFSYESKQHALNAPTRMFGFDENSQRVELTADAIRDTRGLPLLSA